MMLHPLIQVGLLLGLVVGASSCTLPAWKTLSPTHPSQEAIAQDSGRTQPTLTTRGDGQIHIDPLPVEAEYRNEWPDTLEAEFWQRANIAIDYFAGQSYGNTHQENEKRSYPYAMFDFLAGNREVALEFLQQEDAQASDHDHTGGIDYYYAFTLKGQIRKYFFFGSWLEPTYRDRMTEAARLWTAEDPVDRPHPLYGRGDGTGEDWSVRRRGLWVDSRNTDNLRAMRETAVYLMAEATGNEATRLLYKQHLQRYVTTLYSIGMGEWDSSNYHGHTFAAYLNLYDFAQDPEVKQLAKDALDWFSTAAAVKYYRGAWAGPSKRESDRNNVVFGSAAARLFWHYFGDASVPNPEPERDAIHVITSAYRPPEAVVALARKQFSRPVELLSSKPYYENWKSGNDDEPAFWETTFWGQTYQMGSVVSTFADGDVAPFKLLANNAQRGVDVVAINTGRDRLGIGKQQGDQIGQYRNLLIWLRPASDERSFFIQLPKTAHTEVENDIWFVRLERTWLALHLIHLTPNATVEITQEKLADLYQDEMVIQAGTTGDDYAGFALEVGEPNSYQNYEDFKRAIHTQTALDLEHLRNGDVTFTGSSGHRLSLQHNEDNARPTLYRDGIELDWDEHRELYYSLGDDPPIHLGWKQGHLSVRAGGHTFEAHRTGDRSVP